MLGTLVRCPDCGGTFEPGGRPVELEPPPPGPPDTSFAATPAAAQSRPCPYCGEVISTATVRCPHCRQDFFEEDDRPWERHVGARVRRDSLPHRGTLILIFGILSFVVPYCIGVAFGIAAWAMGQNDLKRMNAGEMDPAGRSLTQAGRICGIVGAIFQGLLTVMVVAIMVFTILLTSAMPPPPPRVAPVPIAPVAPAKPPAHP
jgi:hypothetical protein